MLNEYVITKTAYWRRALDTDKIPEILQNLGYWAPTQTTRLVSNQGGWQSPAQTWTSLPWMQSWLEDEQLWVSEIYRHMGWTESRPVMGGYWFNINPRGAFNWPHQHPRTRISTVCWLQASEGSGDLVFDCVNQPQWPPEQDTEYTRAALGLQPQAGQQIAFPAQIQHRVTPNLTDELRVSIAVNWC